MMPHTEELILATDPLPLGPDSDLTSRERSVVRMVIQGMKNREIALALHTTEGGIKLTLNRVYVKLGVRSRYELALAARYAGLTPPEEVEPSCIEKPKFDAEWMFGCAEPI